MNIIEACNDPQILGGRDLKTRQRWSTFKKVVYGLPLMAEELTAFQHDTNRQVPREGGYPEAAFVGGCQCGKTENAAEIGVFEAMQAVLSGQRNVYIVLIAQDTRAAVRALFGYVKDMVSRSPVLSAEVVRETADLIEFRGGVTIAVYPCRPAAIRGIRATIVIVDELAHFISTDGRPTDIEVLRAARSRIATTGGKVLILSSPYGQSGALWELHRKHYGREDSATLVWQASAPEMNPTLPSDYLQRMEQDDPEAYRSEVLGEFRAGVSSLFDPDALDACVEPGVKERAPNWGTWGAPEPPPYVGFVDAASGSGKDAFTCAIGHVDGERLVLDCVRAWRPPFNPSAVIEEVSNLLRSYSVNGVRGDRYAPGFVSEGFQRHGVSYLPSTLDRSGLYLEFLPLVNAGRARLLDRPDLLRELRGLERRRGTSGRDRVDHRSGAHDDLANSVAGVFVQLAQVGVAELRLVKITGI